MITTSRLALVCIALAFLMTACAKTPPKCAIETLILDEKLLPEGTYAERLTTAIPEKPKESASRSFYYAPYDIFHMVINWHSARAAKREFIKEVGTAFDTDKYMGPWETPSQMYNSSTADNYYAACGTALGFYQCRLIATYGEYSVYFRADVGEEGITLLKVNEILQAIDERMAECLD